MGISGTTSLTLGSKVGEHLSSADFGVSCTTNGDDVFYPARTAIGNAGGGVLYIPSCSGGWSATSDGDPDNMTFEVDGPSIYAGELLQQGVTDLTSGKAWAHRLPVTPSVNAFTFETTSQSTGSPTKDQAVVSIKDIQDIGAAGGINGLVVTMTGRGSSNAGSDLVGANIFVQNENTGGFTALSEEKVQESPGEVNQHAAYQIDVQRGIEGGSTHIGENWTADYGTNTALFNIVGTSSSDGGRWGSIISNTLDGTINYQLDDTGAVTTTSGGSSTTTIKQSNISGVETVQNANNQVIYTLDQNGNLKVSGNIQGISASGSATPLAANSGLSVSGGLASVSSGLSVSGGSVLDGGTIFTNNGAFNLQNKAVGVTWNASNGGGEADILVPGDAGGPNGFSVYQEGSSDTASSAVKVWGVDGAGNVSVTGNETIKGAVQAGSYATASLPTNCTAGQQLYDTDGRKTGESVGNGSGVPVICTATSKGGPTAWYSMFSGLAVMD